MNHGIEVKILNIDDATWFASLLRSILRDASPRLNNHFFEIAKSFIDYVDDKIRENDLCTELPYSTNQLVEMINDLREDQGERIEELKQKVEWLEQVMTEGIQGAHKRMDTIDDMTSKLEIQINRHVTRLCETQARLWDEHRFRP